MSLKWRIVGAWLVAIVVFDRLSKIVVDRSMAPHRSIPIIDGFFNLTYVRNTGAAFGIFAGSAEIFRRPFLITVSLIAIAFIFAMLNRLADKARWLITGLAFILGGAVGNLIDRVVYGEVIDFLDCFWGDYHWPAFNLADSFITVGVTIILIILIRAKGEDPFAAA